MKMLTMRRGWKAARLGSGGSDAAAILGLNPYKSNVELFDEKTGRRMPKDISDKPYVKYGTEAEPLIPQAVFVGLSGISSPVSREPHPEEC